MATAAEKALLLPWRKFELKYGEGEFRAVGRALYLQEWPSDSNIGVGSCIWDAGVVLTKFLEKTFPSLQGKKVIELGAGVGLAGLVCGLLGAEVWLTDLKQVLPITKANIDLNAPGNPRFHVVEYSWGENPNELLPPYDLIVASDVVYREELFEPLITSLQLLSGEHTVIYLSYLSRSQRHDEIFLKLCSPHFNVEWVPKAQLDPEWTEDRTNIYKITPKKVTTPAMTEKEFTCGSDEKCTIT